MQAMGHRPDNKVYPRHLLGPLNQAGGIAAQGTAFSRVSGSSPAPSSASLGFGVQAGCSRHGELGLAPRGVRLSVADAVAAGLQKKS